MMNEKKFSKFDEGRSVEVAFIDRIVRGTVLSISEYGYRVDIKEIIREDGGYRVWWGIPSNWIHVVEGEEPSCHNT